MEHVHVVSGSSKLLLEIFMRKGCVLIERRRRKYSNRLHTCLDETYFVEFSYVSYRIFLFYASILFISWYRPIWLNILYCNKFLAFINKFFFRIPISSSAVIISKKTLFILHLPMMFIFIFPVVSYRDFRNYKFIILFYNSYLSKPMGYRVKKHIPR